MVFYSIAPTCRRASTPSTVDSNTRLGLILPLRHETYFNLLPERSIADCCVLLKRSHGLGNPRLNALPRCQLARLGKLIRVHLRQRQWPAGFIAPSNLVFPRPVPRVCLWIDTLCIPIRSGKFEKRSEAREKAISYMGEIYHRAATTLVLDASLLASSVHCSLLERQLRVSTCDWMRRLWTLQEAVVSGPKRLWFQFRERTLSSMELIRDVNLYYSEQAYVAIFGRIPFDLSEISVERPDLLFRTVQALVYRTTSRRTDETICISNMLRLDTARILETRKPVRRMKLFMAQMAQAGQIPSHIIFVSGKRLRGRGCAWMPRTFFSDDAIKSFGFTTVRSRPAIFDRRGLYVTYPGILLNMAKIDVLFPEFGFQNPFCRSWCQVVPIDPDTADKRLIKQWKSWLWCVSKLKDFRAPAIILDSAEGTFEVGGTAILVDVETEVDGTLFVRFYCRFELLVRSQMDTSNDCHPGIDLEDDDLRVLDLKVELDRARRVYYGPKWELQLPYCTLTLSTSAGSIRAAQRQQRWCVG